MRRSRKPSGPSRASCARHPGDPGPLGHRPLFPGPARAEAPRANAPVRPVEYLHIAARSTTEVIDALESRDLVERRADPGDRRATLVELTEHGTSILDAIRRPAEPRPNGSSAVSQTDRAHLARILRKLQN